MIAPTLVGVKVSPPENGGRRLVITDIHGCALTFERLLEKIELTTEDQLFLLGDFINRGPRSKQVIYKVLELEEDGYNVFPLMGNQEESVLEAMNEKPSELKAFLRARKARGLLNTEGRIRKRIFRFLRRLPYYYDLGDHYLVHAGFNLKIENPMSDTHAMVWVRNFKLEEKMNGRKVIFGHNPSKFSKIEANVTDNTPSLCLDNGCSHAYLGKSYGRLICYDLDSRQLYKQKNID